MSGNNVSKSKTLLVETAWEVCNQVGGIYTVVRSKIPEMVRHWKKDFFLMAFPAIFIR